MTVNTLDFDEIGGAPVPAHTPDIAQEDDDVEFVKVGALLPVGDRSSHLANLVDNHKEWADKRAMELLERNGGIFELQAMKAILRTRTDIQCAISAYGATAQHALEDLILESARALAVQIGVA